MYSCGDEPTSAIQFTDLNGKWFQVFKNDSSKEETFAFIFKDINKEIYFLKNDSILHKTNYDLRFEDNLEIMIIKKYPFPSIKRNADGTFTEVLTDHKYIFNLVNDTTFTIQFLSNSESSGFKVDPPLTYIRK